MSLQLIAKQMEAKGRKGDSMLVHMTPGEVAGLQKLAESAGGSLSVNPDTGLVEANFLKQMLPTLVGAGVGFMTMNPMLGAAAGAAVGGFQARRSDQDVMTGMLMGGMGGYGGATIGSGISAAGAPAANVGAEVAKNTAAQIPLQQAAQAQALQQQAMQQAAMAEGAKLSGAEAAMMGVRTLPVAAAPVATAAQAASVIPGPTVPVTPPARTFADLTSRERMDQGLRGLKALGTKEGRDIAYKDIGGSEGFIRAATFGAMPYLNAASAGDEPQNLHPLLSSRIDRSIPNQSVEAYKGRMPSYNYKGRNVYEAVPTFRAADGGSIGDSTDGGNSDSGGLGSDAIGRRLMETSPTMQKLFGQLSPGMLERLGVARQEEAAPSPAIVMSAPELRAYEPEMPQYSYENGAYIPTFRAAQGGLLGLAKGGLASGGFVVPADVVSMIGEGNTDAGYKRIKSLIPTATAIKGKDGGQADTVKTHIDGKQPARVAHGEMYIPPATVKRMGGAKKLYAMMDRVRHQATGSRKQIRPVSLKKAMA